MSKYVKRGTLVIDTAERLLELFERNPRVNGIVYAYYEDYRKMRDVIEAYVFRHGGRI
jgi:hypothetical protein